MPYKLTCEIETSQVEIEEKLLDGEGTILPIVSNDESSSVPTMFRLDNFDTVVEQVEGEGSVNTNHMMAFQEMTPETKTNDNKVQIQSTKKKDSLWAVNLNQLMQISIQKKKKKNPSSLRLSGKVSKIIQALISNISCGYYFEKCMELTSLTQAMIMSFRTSLVRFSFVYSCVINT